jgi:hypothetical protein
LRVQSFTFMFWMVMPIIIIFEVSPHFGVMLIGLFLRIHNLVKLCRSKVISLIVFSPLIKVLHMF